MTKLLIDGVFFQIANTGIARVWRSVIELLVQSKRFEIYFLDRGNAPNIAGIEYIPFPKNLFCYCPEDSILIQKICDHYQIDIFTSTYYTTPIKTPMLLMVYDMIPELFDFDLNVREWMEKETAISYAQRYLCISYNTRNDLMALYPEIPENNISVAHCGVDKSIFHPRTDAEISQLCNEFGLNKPYFLFVGSRIQHNGYKNSQIFFDALPLMINVDFDIFCVGGEREIEPTILESLPKDMRCIRVELTDDELAIAYAGALALVYPSLYEGFGMPVIEAMASGCPVITTHHGSLAEAAGDSASLISGLSEIEMRNALLQMHDNHYRQDLKQKGFEHASNFCWQKMADCLIIEFEKLLVETKSGKYDTFFSEWERLRKVQADVDFLF